MPSPVCRQRLYIGLTAGQPMHRSIPLPIASALQSPYEWLEFCDDVNDITSRTLGSSKTLKRLPFFKGSIYRTWGGLIAAVCNEWSRQRAGIQVVFVPEQGPPDSSSTSRHNAHFQVLIYDPEELLQELRNRQCGDELLSRLLRQQQRDSATSAPRPSVVAEPVTQPSPLTPSTEVVSVSCFYPSMVENITTFPLDDSDVENVPIISAEVLGKSSNNKRKKVRPQANVVMSVPVIVMNERLPVSKIILE